jgi:hypothetical protein
MTHALDCPRCKALAQALTPFVLAAQFYGPEWHDSDDLARANVSPLSVGDLRRAVALLLAVGT